MNILHAKALQKELLTKKTVTLLVVPGPLKGYPVGSARDFPWTEPYVVQGDLVHDSFFVPRKRDGQWDGVHSVVIKVARGMNNMEIPVVWISSHLEGRAFVLVDPDGHPCELCADFNAANERYFARWSPQAVHAMTPSRYPKILDLHGTTSFRATAWSIKGYRGLDYPWHA